MFGEMGMLTGEPRRATVTARTDVVCYRLDKPGFQEVLRSRSGGLAQAQAEAASAGLRSNSLLERMRAFFGIESGQDAPRRAA